MDERMADNKNKRNFNYRRGRKCDFHSSSKDRRDQFLATERLNERDVGITEYITPNLPGFTGVIKARYSDFHVNEINTLNVNAKLTDLKAPENFYKNTNDEIEDDSEFKRLITEDVLKQLHDMVGSDDDLHINFDAEKLNKLERSVIYDGIRGIFGNRIVANTITKDDKKVILFKKHKKGTPLIDNRKKWPSDKGQYVYFLVYKESLDTLEACFKIADCLKMNPSWFTYAGVKDRRGKTTQWFCAYKLDPYKLINKTKPITKIQVGNLSFHTEPLKLGDLNGNHFKVALRNVTVDDIIISNAMDSFKEKGFINYYGLQRFGNDKEVSTYEIGVQLLLGKFKEACDLILKVKSTEDATSEVGQAKRIYSETKNCQLAAAKFRRLSNSCVESKLLLGLVKNGPNDYVNSLENIPRNMRLLYIHAFQSLVWNKVVSLRLQKYGLEPIEGDIVLLKEKSNEIRNHENIKILSKDDLNQYTINDIVLPLPGYDIQYPENELKNTYKEILGGYGLTLEMPKQSVKTYTLSGSYRKLICQACNFSWKLIHYDHPDDTLIRSDYEELIGHDEIKDNLSGKYKGIVVEFTLPSSAYATMALREILKMDTSCTVHAKLNQYEKPSNETSNVTAALNESKETFPVSNSLLGDTEKYEQFKRQVFGGDMESVDQSKRKLEDSEDSVATKKNKIGSENK